MNNEALRIIQVVNVRWFNATAWYALFLARLLRRAGHSVLVLGLEGTGSFKKARDWGLEPRPLALNSKSIWDQLGLHRQIHELRREFRPHLVNCHRGEGYYLWCLEKVLDQRHPFALVRTRGDQRPPGANILNRLLHGRPTDALIAANSRTAGEFEHKLGIAPAKIHRILGGVDGQVFFPDSEARERWRAAWGLAPEEKAIGILGRFDPIKGQRESIAAFARIYHGGRRDIRLILAGFSSASSEEEVRSWLREAGIEKQALITGRCEDVRGCVNAFDLGLISSRGSEAIARAALEIMACGVPLLGTRVGVMPDLLSEQALFAPGDVDALERSLAAFLRNPALAPSLCAEQAEIMKELTAENFLRKTLAAYKSAMKNAGIKL